MPFNARIHQCAWRRSVVVAACGAWAQQRERMRRIVAQGLQELGWNIGCMCGFDYRWGAADLDLPRRGAVELVALAPCHHLDDCGRGRGDSVTKWPQTIMRRLTKMTVSPIAYCLRYHRKH
jgi:hypothetical protein